MGETFGRYTVVGQLGRGAMGVVYLANDPMLNRQVAVKTVDLGVDEPEEREFLRNRLLRDARAAAVLKHPNIVAIYDVFEENGRAYVVMEYIAGESLAARLKNGPPLDSSGCLKMLQQTADALDYTHARGVIHRDIKPGNIMIDSTGTAKIMDFGIARITDTRTVTPTGMVMGTVEYMAPEQILGETLDGRADQFALAVVAYQMMTGSTLFGPNSVATVTYKIVNEVAPPPSTRNSALPRGVDAVLAKALSKKPQDRFVSCMEFVGALSLAFSEAPTAPVASPTAAAAVPARVAQTTAALPANTVESVPVVRSRVPVAVAALAVVLVGGALAAVIWKPWNRTEPASVLPAVSAVKPAAADKGLEGKANSVPVSKAGAVKEPETRTEASPEKRSGEQPVKRPPLAVEKAKASPAVVEPAEPIDEDLPSVPEEPKGARGATPFALALRGGEQQVKNNDYQGALDSFSRAISLRPKSAQAYYSRGTVYQHLNRMDLAKQDFSTAISFEPTLVQAHTGLGNCLVREKRDDEAFAEFQRAIELNPAAVLALEGRGNIYLRRKQYRLALADFDKVLNIRPRFQPAYTSRANAREAIGDLAGAAADRRMLASLRQ